MSGALDTIPDVDIDSGKFKYILIKVLDPKSKDNKYIVRGYTSAEFHNDIYNSVEPKIKETGLESQCVGGGKIIHDQAAKTIKVFGQSQGYGPADHQVSSEILKRKFPGFDITWTTDG